MEGVWGDEGGDLLDLRAVQGEQSMARGMKVCVLPFQA